MDWRVSHLLRSALKFGIALLLLLSILSIILGVVLYYEISIDETQYRLGPSRANRTKKDEVIIGDKLDANLLWFLQVTDLHLSSAHKKRETDFAEFSTTYIDIFKPDAVLVTGDITDARLPNTGGFGTGQNLDEWQAYWSAIAGGANKTRWLDIRGNHDNFNVYRPQDSQTPSRRFTVMGRRHARNYYEIIEKVGTGGGDKSRRYTFIGVDEVQTPGLKIFNFLGVVKEEDLNELGQFKASALREKSEFTVWFGHYPTSSIASKGGNSLRGIIDGPYLCGHFHTVGNRVTRMYASQQAGFVEAELGDWKDNRLLRLAAVDHQLFSFVDFKFREFPVALMTNPKSSHHSMPQFEPLDRIPKSTHIRVLAFSNARSIKRVELSIDGGTWQSLAHSTGALWVLKWNPEKYQSNGQSHKVKIFIEDSLDQNRTYEQSFTLDQSSSSKEEYFSLGARILLRPNFETNMAAVFYLIVLTCTAPLLILRSNLVKCQYEKASFLCNLQRISNSNLRLFLPLLAIPVWLAAGPLYLGYLVDGALCACFTWGVLLIEDGTFLHTALTYNLGSIFLVLVHIPEILLLAYQYSCSSDDDSLSYYPADISRVRAILHVAVTMLQLYMGYIIYSAHGSVALLTSVPFVWCLLLYAYCWCQCSSLNFTTRRSTSVWSINSRSRLAESDSYSQSKL